MQSSGSNPFPGPGSSQSGGSYRDDPFVYSNPAYSNPADGFSPEEVAWWAKNNAKQKRAANPVDPFQNQSGKIPNPDDFNFGSVDSPFNDLFRAVHEMHKRKEKEEEARRNSRSGQWPPPPQPPKDSDPPPENIEVDVQVTAEESLTGCTKRVFVQSKNPIETCRTCGGSGRNANAPKNAGPPCIGCVGSGRTDGHPCRFCNGTGRKTNSSCVPCMGKGKVKYIKHVNIGIPAGVTTGAKLRARGQGNHLGTADVILNITVEKAESYVRKGRNIEIEREISFLEALTGTIDGFTSPMDEWVEYTIPGLTQEGTSFVIPDRGPPLPGGGRGDLVIVVKLVMPKKLSPRAQILIEELKNELK